MGQGFVLNYRSGFTEGPVGFGLDAVGMIGIRLDSGKGHHYNPNSTASNGNIFPTAVNPTVNTTRSTHVNEFWFAGGRYIVSPDLTLQDYYANLTDFYKQHFVGGVYGFNLGPGRLTTDVRYWDNRSDGRNSHDPDYYSSGYYGNGRARGEVDSRLSSVLFTYAVGPHAFSTGYQQVDGDSDAVWANEGAGTTSYFFTDTMSGKFQRAGGRTWQLRYVYDFASVGVLGLSFKTNYYNGNNIETASGQKKEWARDMTLDYVVQSGHSTALRCLPHRHAA